MKNGKRLFYECLTICFYFCLGGFPNPRVGSSNLSTPAILKKAHIERYEPFCYLRFRKRTEDSSIIRLYMLEFDILILCLINY